MILDAHLMKLHIPCIAQKKSAIVHVLDPCHHIWMPGNCITCHGDINICKSNLRYILLCKSI
ncbi:hypothetical protein D3C78_1011850 [compost metagenome]